MAIVLGVLIALLIDAVACSQFRKQEMAAANVAPRLPRM
jgi:hypothetical protein